MRPDGLDAQEQAATDLGDCQTASSQRENVALALAELIGRCRGERLTQSRRDSVLMVMLFDESVAETAGSALSEGRSPKPDALIHVRFLRNGRKGLTISAARSHVGAHIRELPRRAGGETLLRRRSRVGPANCSQASGSEPCDELDVGWLIAGHGVGRHRGQRHVNDRFHVETHLIEKCDVSLSDDPALLAMCRRLNAEHGPPNVAITVRGYLESHVWDVPAISALD